MTVIFSKKCELGLQAVLLLSTLDKDALVNSGYVAETLKVPKEFVSKVMQTLTNDGIIGSKKGHNGGFYLAKNPGEIKLIDIVKSLDGLNVFNQCVLGFPGCSHEKPCPVHDTWGKIRDEAFKMLSEQSLSDVKDKVIAKINTL
jgi:Rrf2 family iron-sulfur cluster assembly transcriptional regulator